MSTQGDIAVLQFGNDGKWRWKFLTPSSLSTLALNIGTDPVLSAFDASGAASAAQSFAIQRANQTGTQTASTISDLTAAAIAAVTWSTLTGKPTFSTVATSGSYADLSGKPSLGTQMSADTGWTANNTAGDKTAALSSYSNGLNGTMVTALNVVSGGTGTALSAAMDVLVIVVKKLAALETALVAAKLPNA